MVQCNRPPWKKGSCSSCSRPLFSPLLLLCKLNSRAISHRISREGNHWRVGLEGPRSSTNAQNGKITALNGTASCSSTVSHCTVRLRSLPRLSSTTPTEPQSQKGTTHHHRRPAQPLRPPLRIPHCELPLLRTAASILALITLADPWFRCLGDNCTPDKSTCCVTGLTSHFSHRPLSRTSTEKS